MKLSELLKEIEKYSAIAKDSGKTVYFKSKKGKDAAIKAGTHTEKKSKKSDTKSATKSKGAKIDFKSSAEKSKAPLYKKINSYTRDTSDVLNALVDKYYKQADDATLDKYKKQQSDYWNGAVKNKEFSDNVIAWRDLNVQTSREKLDKFIIKNPPPPIETKNRIWRGMGMTKQGYEKFLKSIKDKTEIKLPPSSFSFAVDIARYRAEDSNMSVVIGVKSECNELKGLALSRVPGKQSAYEETEQEIITPSNATYKVESIKELEDSRGDRITVVSLIQKCGMKESDETVADFSKDPFMYSVFGPTQNVKK